MNATLYEVLGIDRDAPAGAVTKAYRALAKRFHPDRNPGCDDAKAKFAAVDQAYRVLFDSDRRAKYDRTGEVDAPRPDNSVAEIMSILSPCLFAVLKEIVKQGGKVKEEDVVHHMRHALTHGRKELEKNLSALEADKVMLAVATERFEVMEGDEPNLLAMAAREHVKNVDKRIEQTARELERMRKSLEFLKKCRYRADAKKLIGSFASFAGSGATATSSWSW
jgi:hypothetical protein